MSKPGIISICEYDIEKLNENLQKIPSQETVTKALEIRSEDEIKEYMEGHLEEIEAEFTKRCIDEVNELKDLGIDLRLYKCKKQFEFTCIS